MENDKVNEKELNNDNKQLKNEELSKQEIWRKELEELEKLLPKNTTRKKLID